MSERDELIALIMDETTDDLIADGWDRLGKPNVLVQGCRYLRRKERAQAGEGYENPEAYAKQFAGFIADRILAKADTILSPRGEHTEAQRQTDYDAMTAIATHLREHPAPPYSGRQCEEHVQFARDAIYAHPARGEAPSVVGAEPCDAAKLLAYQDAHDVAAELGYPSLTEALEALAALSPQALGESLGSSPKAGLPTEGLDAAVLDKDQLKAIERAAMDAQCTAWRRCRLAMVEGEEVVGYPAFSRADMAELARLYREDPAPSPTAGDE